MKYIDVVNMNTDTIEMMESTDFERFALILKSLGLVHYVTSSEFNYSEDVIYNDDVKRPYKAFIEDGKLLLSSYDKGRITAPLLYNNGRKAELVADATKEYKSTGKDYILSSVWGYPMYRGYHCAGILTK